MNRPVDIGQLRAFRSFLRHGLLSTITPQCKLKSADSIYSLASSFRKEKDACCCLGLELCRSEPILKCMQRGLSKS